MGELSTTALKTNKRKELVIITPLNPLISYNNKLKDNDKFIASNFRLKSPIDLYNVYIKTLKV
jgi:hypothetical protein